MCRSRCPGQAARWIRPRELRSQDNWCTTALLPGGLIVEL